MKNIITAAKNLLLNKIALFLKNKLGCEYVYEEFDINIIRRSILIKKLMIHKCNKHYEYISTEHVHIKIYFLKSIFNISLTGEIFLSDTKFHMNIVSENLVKLENTIITFKLKRNLTLICIEIEDIIINIQLVLKNKYKELIVNIPNFTFNNINAIFYNVLKSDILKFLYSENKIQFNLWIKKQSNIDIPLCKLHIDYKTLNFHHNNKKYKYKQINDSYLINTLNKKTNNDIYLKFKDIPVNLINTIILTEDPLFWTHNGIASEFIGLALATNIKENKISRGASTITMQLMRNLFLTQERNLLRKFEEFVLAILFENYYKLSKQFILELYLNIIEFAPNTHGLYEASIFYFNKKYSSLDFIEIITLTYIIPRPRHFCEALIIKSSQLESNLYNHLIVYSELLLHNNLICVEDFLLIRTVKKINFSSALGTIHFDRINNNPNYFDKRSLVMLNGIHPHLVAILEESIKCSPIKFVIYEGIRTIKRQKILYAQGRSTEGKIVTYCDGLINKSNHQLKKDGFGYAVDIYPCINNMVKITESYVPYLLKIIASHIQSKAKELGIIITWGGEWEIKDYSHFELSIDININTKLTSN